MILAAVAPPARAQTGLPGELRVVADVRLSGRIHVRGREIRAVLKTRPASLLPWRAKPALRVDFLRADTLAIESVLQQHGYLDARAHARVGPATNPSEAIVTFVIEEGPRSKVGSVTLTGVYAYPIEQLKRRLLARPGRPFNPAYLIADTTRISRAYQERGYIPHVQAGVTREGLRVDVRYGVSEGPLYHFGDVAVISPGGARVRETLIRRELLIRKGEVYRYPRVERSIERLYETGLFSQVQMTALVDSTQSSIDLDLRVRERKPRWIDAGIGSGTAERFRSTAEWGHRNVGGRGLQGVVSSRLALDGGGRFLLTHSEASLLEPWVGRTRTRGLVTGYYERRDDRADPRWVIGLEAKGFSFELRRELGRFARVSLLEDNAFVTQSIEFRDPNVSTLVRQSLTDSVPPHYTTHRLQLGLDRDLRDNPLNPSKGSAQNLSGEVAGGPLKGTSSFTKGLLASSWYSPLPNGWILASRVRAGVIRPFGERATFSPDPTLDSLVQRVPLTDRFRTGGVNSIRGYNESSIPFSGGLAMLEGSLELRIPVFGPFGVEAYVDAGNVWLRPSHVRASQFRPSVSHRSLDPADVRYVVGIGPRVNLPVGPLRIDFTWSLRPSEHEKAFVAKPQFAIGPSF
ncbi:MAG TPA: BamA/TamA family outer membrane protein [Candidatus Eisenbacteria bacterium]